MRHSVYMAEVTQILNEIHGGNETVAADLLPIVYADRSSPA